MVPAEGRPYGWCGNISGPSARPATVPGFCSDRRRPAWISPILRATSSAGNAGCSSTSASRSRPRGRSFFSTESDRVALSRPAPASRLPPTNSMARSRSGPERRVVPRVIESAVRLARPSASSGSRTEPPGTEICTTTMGMAGRSATSSTAPFGSISRWASGAAADAGSTSSSSNNSIAARDRMARAPARGQRAAAGAAGTGSRIDTFLRSIGK